MQTWYYMAERYHNMRLQKLTKAWFDMEGDPDNAKFEIKHLLNGEITEIVEQAYKQRYRVFRIFKLNEAISCGQ